jgi:hypothetical protein
MGTISRIFMMLGGLLLVAPSGATDLIAFAVMAPTLLHQMKSRHL